MECRKDERIQDLQSQLESVQTVVNTMKVSLKRAVESQCAAATREEELKRKLEASERSLKEAKSLRPSFAEETGIQLDRMSTSRGVLEASLAKKNLGVVDLYTRVVTLEEELAKMKKGKEECEMYLEHVLKEVEEKTPQLQQRQAEYLEMVQRQQRLTKMYSVACADVQEKDRKLTALQASVQAKEQQNEKLQRVAEDLQKQLRALLKQQIKAGSEEDRAKLYTSVEELQASNQRLLEKIHGLEVEGESSHASSTETQKIAELEKEVESMNALRKEQEALMATITKQRDMYRVLLSQKDAEAVGAETPSVLQSTHLELKRQMEESQNKLNSQLEREQATCTELRQSVKSAEEQLARTTELLRVEKQCGEQKDQMVRRLQASLDTMQLQIHKLEQENTSLQHTLTERQKDLDQERLKVRLLEAFHDRRSTCREPTRSSTSEPTS